MGVSHVCLLSGELVRAGQVLIHVLGPLCCGGNVVGISGFYRDSIVTKIRGAWNLASPTGFEPVLPP